MREVTDSKIAQNDNGPVGQFLISSESSNLDEIVLYSTLIQNNIREHGFLSGYLQMKILEI